MKSILLVAIMMAGCEYPWCDWLCGDNEPVDTASEYSCENPGPGGACLCYCTNHLCHLENCTYYEDAYNADIVCWYNQNCQLWCNPNDDPDGCAFDTCEGELLYCSRYGWACNEVCPNTK